MYISYEETEKAADAFLNKHHPSREVPVPIEHMVEIALGISIMPQKGLFARESIDAFLSQDFSELYIDEEHYMGQTNRSRFTLAHEVGHYVLHGSIVSKITTYDEWRRFMLGEGSGRDFYEVHADNFAGCLLMPRQEVETEYKRLRALTAKQFEKAGLQVTDERMVISFIANGIGKKFDVSQKAAEVRLSKILLK